MAVDRKHVLLLSGNIILTDISIHFQTFSACQGKQDVCQQKLQRGIDSPWESKPKAVHNDLKSKNPVICVNNIIMLVYSKLVLHAFPAFSS